MLDINDIAVCELFGKISRYYSYSNEYLQLMYIQNIAPVKTETQFKHSNIVADNNKGGNSARSML